MHLLNATPFIAECALLFNGEGVQTFYTIVKATFDVESECLISDEQVGIQSQDLYWGEPGQSSLHCASDYQPLKSATDIVVLGQAIAPMSQAVQELDVDIRVGLVTKKLRIFGDRHWQAGHISPPEPFVSMPLLYENAYGGMSVINGQLHSMEQRNPIGKGFCDGLSATEVDGKSLPNIEDANNLISSVDDAPEPAAPGFRPAHWLPRAKHCGTFNKEWQQKMSPSMPSSYDPRFQNAAHPDLIYPGFLLGGEKVTITHMHPNKTVAFSVPSVNLGGHFKTQHSSRHSLNFSLETLIIIPEKEQVQLVWKAASPCRANELAHAQAKVTLVRSA